MIGSAAGAYADPTVIKGQRLTDAQIQTSSEGAFRTIVYGIGVCAGNLIQCGALIEHKNKERAGKGGSTVQESFTYTRTYAIRVCEGPVAGIRRIWRDDKLVYDVRDPYNPDDGITDTAKWAEEINAMAADTAKFAGKIVIYLGGETQLPDPYLEALPTEHGGGIGNVPAYRGSCYVVFRDDDLTPKAGAVPQYRFEIAAAGSIGHVLFNYGVYASVNNSGELLTGPDYLDWNDTTDTGVTPTSALTLVQSAKGLVYFFNDGQGRVSADRGFSFQEVTGLPAGVDPQQLLYAPEAKMFLYLPRDGQAIYTSLDGVHFIVRNVTEIPPGQASEAMCHVIGGIYLISGSGFIIRSINNGLSWTSEWSGIGEGKCMAVADNAAAVLCVGTLGLLRSTDYGLNWSPVTHPLPASHPHAVAYGNGRFLILDTAGNCAASDDNGATWDLVTPMPENMDGHTQSKFIFYDNVFMGCDENVHVTSDGSAWETVLVGPGGPLESITGLSLYGATAIPDVVGWYYINGSIVGTPGDTVIQTPVYLGDIEHDIADRVGIEVAAFDTTQIDAIRVRGFIIGAQMPASESLRSLQRGYFHDLPEWGDAADKRTMLRAIVRGGTSLFALTDDDLVESDDDEDTRRQAVEFPLKLHLISADPNANYESPVQTASRRTYNVKAVGELTVELPLSLLRDEAAQKADIMLKVAWEEALGRWQRQLPEEYSQMTPSDCFTHGGKRWRADKIEYADGVVSVDAVRDRISAYTSDVTGSTGVDPQPPVSTLRGQTEFVAWNGPQLRSQENTPGVYVAAKGVLSGWVGAQLQLSLDGGITFNAVLDMLDPATMGFLAADFPDSSNVLEVDVEGGTLESATPEQLAARQNGFVILTSDVAEVGQFEDAYLNSAGFYELTNLLRGQLGTLEDDHFEGDRFVLIDGAVLFLAIDPAYAGTTLIFRPVSMGTPEANNATFSLVYNPGAIIIDGGGAPL